LAAAVQWQGAAVTAGAVWHQAMVAAVVVAFSVPSWVVCLALLLVCICTTTFSAVTMVALLPMVLIKPALAIMALPLKTPITRAQVATSMITLAAAAVTSAMMLVMTQAVVVGSAVAAVTTVVAADGLAVEIMAAAVISVAAETSAVVVTSVAVVTNSPTIIFL
jgi:hypothetical protein